MVEMNVSSDQYNSMLWLFLLSNTTDSGIQREPVRWSLEGDVSLCQSPRLDMLPSPSPRPAPPAQGVVSLS